LRGDVTTTDANDDDANDEPGTNGANGGAPDTKRERDGNGATGPGRA
jgi:hypothetical protein